MNSKKWTFAFLSFLAFFLLLWALLNVLVDPFGVFGDRILDYYEYNATQNPRVAKIAFLDKNPDKYDSFVIGCSKSSSLPTETLNKYFDADFYNMIMYGGDMYDIEKTCEYILETRTAKNIVVCIGLEEAVKFNSESDPVKANLHAKVEEKPLIPFYFKYLFLNPEYAKNKLISYKNRSYLITPDEVFIAESGEYNKSRRDTEKIPKLDEYLEENTSFNSSVWKSTLNDADKCVASLKRIKEMCDNKEVNLVIIASPVYEKELTIYNEDELKNYFKKIAEEVSFWNFSGYTSISNEPRYFYDTFHFRNCVGDMILAKIFNDTSVYIPDDFGIYTTNENKDDAVEKAFEKNSSTTPSVNLPVLLYHHLTNDGENVSAVQFEEHILALKNAGYTTVSIKEIEDYTKKGTSLPEKPILITFDDGYLSNVEIAAPILQKHGEKASIAVIGCSIGHTHYKDTDRLITEHFTLEEALPFVENGTLEIISHTWDMHEVENLDPSPIRQGILQKENESEKDYLLSLEKDLKKSKETIEKAFGTPLTALAYPYGKCSEISEVFLGENGIKTTFTIKEETNEIIKGIPQTTRLLGRINVDKSVSGEKLIKLIEKAG